MAFSRFPERTYFFHEGDRFVYAPIPKAACSSMKGVLYRLFQARHPGMPVFLPREFSGRTFHLFMDYNFTLGTLPEERARALLEDPDVLKFTFVRDPLDRIASGFLNKFIAERFNSEQWEHTRPVLAAFHGEGANPVNHAITFEQFVEYLSNTPDEALDKHWRPMTSFLRPGLDIRVCRVERFETDLAALGETLGLELPAHHANRTPRQRSDLPEGSYWAYAADDLRRLAGLPSTRQLYNRTLEEAVRRRFRSDMEAFGY